MTVAPSLNDFLIQIYNFLMPKLTARSLTQTFHDNIDLWIGEDAIFVFIKKHKDFFVFRHLLVRQLPLLL